MICFLNKKTEIMKHDYYKSKLYINSLLKFLL